MKQSEALEILQQGKNTLVTGAAGSGKTHLLGKFAEWARKEKAKNVIITATTGLAATHLNGRTIHNYCNLKISNESELKNCEHLFNLAKNMKYQYKKIVKNTDILIIDEVSMLSNNGLDAVDKIMREVRGNSKSFGGVMTILCGDFFQLPPIEYNNEEVDFITQSDAYKNGNFDICYLEENFRQAKEDTLVKILTSIRSNKVSEEQRNILKNKCINKAPSTEETTKLYCKNKNVDIENKLQLATLSKPSKFYKWKEEGDVNELKKLKNDLKNKVVEELELRKGAKVMFIRNNLKLGYMNGSMGEVTGFDNDGFPEVTLTCKSKPMIVEYDNFYREDEKGNCIAKISQIPLKLAWAITVHKSQGITLDKATIDLSEAFGVGLGYVALSRVKKLDDIILIGINKVSLRVSSQALRMDNELQEKSKETLLAYYNFKNIKSFTKKWEDLYKQIQFSNDLCLTESAENFNEDLEALKTKLAKLINSI